MGTLASRRRGEEGMQKDQIEQVSVAVVTRERTVGEELCRLLSLWSEAQCVRLRDSVWSELTDEDPEPCPSILFLDLQPAAGSPALPPGRLEELSSSCAVVILSDDEDEAIRAYHWHPVACLEPGFTYGELCRAMDRCFRFWRQGLQWLDLPCQWDRVRVPLSQLRYAEGRGRDTILHCTGGEIRVSVPLSKLEAELPAPPFFRCQKSFIVHPDAVEKLTGGELIMRDRLAIAVSRSRKKEIQRLLEQWTFSRGNGV